MRPATGAVHLGRRSVAVGGLLLLTGCTGGTDGTGSTDGTGGTAGTGSSASGGPVATPHEPDPDVELVADALRDEQQLLVRLSAARTSAAVRGAVRVLSDEALAESARVHRAHVALLSEAMDLLGPILTGVPEPTGTPAGVVAGLVRAERALVEQHTATAVRARSGTLARVLAAMAAAAAQQELVLERLRRRLADTEAS
jgi:hypothetical protein